MAYSSYPPPGGTAPGAAYPPGTYPNQGQTFYPPTISTQDYTALRKFFSLRWGEYPKALPEIGRAHV